MFLNSSITPEHLSSLQDRPYELHHRQIYPIKNLVYSRNIRYHISVNYCTISKAIYLVETTKLE